MRRIMPWKEISRRYLFNWIALIAYEWPDKDSFPVSGAVRFHASTREELDRLLSKHPLPDATVLFVDLFEPGRVWSWEKIRETYRDEWVILTKYDWPEGEERPRSAVVTAHARSLDELQKVSGCNVRYRSRYVWVADPKQYIQIVFWVNKHLWDSGLVKKVAALG